MLVKRQDKPRRRPRNRGWKEVRVMGIKPRTEWRRKEYATMAMILRNIRADLESGRYEKAAEKLDVLIDRHQKCAEILENKQPVRCIS